MTNSQPELIEELNQAIQETVDRDGFISLFQRTLEAFDIKDEEVARAKETAMGIVIRWRKGLAVPTKKNRRSVFLALLSIVEKRAAKTDQVNMVVTTALPD